MAEYEPMSDAELVAEYNSVKNRAAVYDLGVRIMLNLIAGPKQWEGIGINAIDADKAPYLARIIVGNPDDFQNLSWVDTQKQVVNTVLQCLWDEFEEWAATAGRQDLLVNTVDLINAALPRDKQIVLPPKDDDGD